MIQKVLFLALLTVLLSCDKKRSSQEESNASTIKNKNLQALVEDTLLVNNLLDRMKARSELSMLVSSIDTLDVVRALQYHNKKRTLFLPSNNAIKMQQKELHFNEIISKHEVVGAFSTITLTRNIRNHGGAFLLTTVGGQTLIAYKEGNTIFLKDSEGNRARLSHSDIEATNGLIHVIDEVMYP